jgi:elongator complex protein 1
VADDISLAPTDASTTGGTLLTRYTGHTNGTLNTQTTRRTSKNRRREERKRARGKKGSVYEEEYLVNSFGRLVDRINSIHEDVTQLIEGLMRRGRREQAKAIEQAMTGVVGLCSEVIGEVFETELDGGEQTNSAVLSEKKTEGMAVLVDAMEVAQKPRQAPMLKAFERLSLLE